MITLWGGCSYFSTYERAEIVFFFFQHTNLQGDIKTVLGQGTDIAHFKVGFFWASTKPSITCDSIDLNINDYLLIAAPCCFLNKIKKFLHAIIILQLKKDLQFQMCKQTLLQQENKKNISKLFKCFKLSQNE